MYATRDEVAEYFTGTNNISFAAVDVQIRNYDFANNEYDYEQECNGWSVEPHPNVEDILSEIDDIEIEVDSKSGLCIDILTPDEDWGVEIYVRMAPYGVVGPAPLRSVKAQLDNFRIDTSKLDLDEEEGFIYLKREDEGWINIIRMFNLDPDLWESGQDDDGWMPVVNSAYLLPHGVLTTDYWHDVMSCCTVVNIDSDLYLALTGAGMDMSWEICETYLRCGYIPPFVFASDLPSAADRGHDELDRMIISACRLSIDCMRNLANRSAQRLDEMFNSKESLNA